MDQPGKVVNPTRGQLNRENVSVGIAYIEQGENRGTTMTLDGVSYSAYTVL